MRPQALWAGAVAGIAAIAAVIGNIETIVQFAEPWISPLFRARGAIELVLEPSSSGETPSGALQVAISTMKDEIVESDDLTAAKPVLFDVSANARYRIFWQGPEIKAASHEILVPRKTIRWSLYSVGREQNVAVLALRNQGEANPVATQPVSARLLVGASAAQMARDPVNRPSAAGITPELDRAVSVIGIFEIGSTECSTVSHVSAFRSNVIVAVGCLASGIPGALSDMIKAVDEAEPGIVDAIFGADALILRSAARATSPREAAAGLSEIASSPERLKAFSDGIKRLAAAPEFRMAHQRTISTYYDRALRAARDLGLNSERGVLFVLDRIIQMGPGSIARLQRALKARVDAGADASNEQQRLKILAGIATEIAPPDFSKMVQRRVDTIVSGTGVIRGVTFDLNALGIRDDRAIAGHIANASP